MDVDRSEYGVPKILAAMKVARQLSIVERAVLAGRTQYDGH